MITTYCKISGTLIQEDIEKILSLKETVSMLSNILGTDVFINCATKDKEKAIVVYHAKPPQNSLYTRNVSGETAISTKEPAVFRSFLTGLPSKNYKAITQEEEDVTQNVIPIKNNDNQTIAVIIVEYKDHGEKKLNSDLLNKTTNNLIKEISVSRTKIPEFVKDGVVVFNRNGDVVYSNKVAKLIYSKLGIYHNIFGRNYENITLTKSKFSKILEEVETKKIKEITISGISLAVSYFLTEFEEKETNVIMIVQDITKEKNDQKELMLRSVAIKEIHHRVKNNLQTIASLLRIQKRRVENEEVKKILDETINRILSIAITHEILSENGFNDLNIKKILKLVYKNFSNTSIDKINKIRFNVIGSDFYTNSETSTAIALVMNEILQNAVDHAFVGREKGDITINAEKTQFCFKISVSDNGVGMNVNERKDKNLGMMIVEKIVKDKLKGTFNVKSKIGKGTTVEFEFKNI
ncbi:sensor histidine kinase [Psychrilyobacter atlanticus]|uniref:sensor histidine kinase n=1 Tax=Psychrilyobacter atlanticus TaxID=271091 RepID=UPI000404B78F|nr:histidine kinase N-terminal domain-containing protein [Psychrilyobacter atlanticus]